MSAYKNQPIAGAAFSLINALMLSLSGMTTKMLSDVLDPIELVFFRNLLGIPLLIIGYIILRQAITLKTTRHRDHIIRGLVGTIGVTLGMWSYSVLPLAEATILFFTAPLFTVILSPFLLREKIGIYRIIAVVIGFGGITIMVGPSTTIPWLGLFAGLGYGFFAALVDICLRWLGNTENSSTTVLYFLAFGLIITGLYMPVAQTWNIEFTETNWIWILVLGIVNVFALLAKTQSFRMAEASIIAPITFTMIIWAFGFDYLLWNRIPGWEVITGGTIIIASNLFIIYREEKVEN